MGTRAQFFIGDPRDVENREWLGTIAWDGYPDGDCGELAKAMSEVGFRALVNHLKATRDDFCDPAKHGFPFPWSDNLFLTDYTYALFDGTVQMTCYHRGFVPLADYINGSDDFKEAYHGGAEKLAGNVPAPTGGEPGGPDSIIILRAG